MKIYLIAGKSLESINYKKIRNDKVECLKIIELDNQQLKLRNEGSSTIIPKGSKL